MKQKMASFALKPITGVTAILFAEELRNTKKNCKPSCIIYRFCNSNVEKGITYHCFGRLFLRFFAI